MKCMSSNRLTEARLKADMTQRELAARLGVAQQAVSSWEHGQEPRASTAVRLAAALGTTADAIWPIEHERIAA